MLRKWKEKEVGNEAPMVIWPRDVVRLGRQIADAVRSARTKRRTSRRRPNTG